MGQAITVANDETLGRAIRSAQRRIVLLAPAVSKGVADALAEQWRTLPADGVSVILDLDPEVYRLGFGDAEGLSLLEEVARSRDRALNRQQGIRIGLLIVDDTTIVYSPTP